MKRKSMIRFGFALLLLAAVTGSFTGAGAGPGPLPAECSSASAWGITPTSDGGATYSISSGAGYCLKAGLGQGTWSLVYSGSGKATSLTCTPIGGVVSGLELTVKIAFHNNRNGHTAVVTETWTQLLPVSPLSITTMGVSPGSTLAQLWTRIFGQCPGQPSAAVQWLDFNVPN